MNPGRLPSKIIFLGIAGLVVVLLWVVMFRSRDNVTTISDTDTSLQTSLSPAASPTSSPDNQPASSVVDNMVSPPSSTSLPTSGENDIGNPSPDSSTSTTHPVCSPPSSPAPRSQLEELGTGDLSIRSVRLSRRLLVCSDRVVVADTRQNFPLAASEFAIQHQTPLLLIQPDTLDIVRSELERLHPKQIVALGDTGLEAYFTLTSVSEAPRPAAVKSGDPQEPSSADDASDPVPTPSPNRIPWILSDQTDPLGAQLDQVYAELIGGQIIPIDSTDIWASPDLDAGLNSTQNGEQTVLVTAPLSGFARYQVGVMQRHPPFQGGGYRLLSGRRLVAFYGSPLTPALGVLGEQDPAATWERLVPVAAEYQTTDRTVIPTFEIIATVASSQPGADGNYSSETDPDRLTEWVELAGENGGYVVLDLQPGRTDFLTQAIEYEELLRLPHVGLALDPEWRLGPNQVHLRQIGSVDAAEANQVIRWLADLVRRHRLPQKLLLVHQFQLRMISNRDQLETPPELAVVIQMDGQGNLASKYVTYSNITSAGSDITSAGSEQSFRWDWGWKNFYDEDRPLATPEEVLALDPEPLFVSYQ